jgi:hypothetical protein
MTSIKNLLLSAEEQRPFSGRSSRKHTKQRSSSGSGRLHFTIEFILDTICPHCYIGLRNLNTAIHLYKQQYPNATFEVACSPFMLKPDAGCSGKRASRLGGPSQVVMCCQRRKDY